MDAPESSPSLTTTPPTSSFLLLPGEIRNTIYRLLLTMTPLHIDTRRRKLDFHYALTTRADVLSIHLHPSLLRTCRQIHYEAQPILYGENTFTAHPSLLTALPHLIFPSRPVYTPELAARITRWKVCVRIDIDARFDGKTATEAFSGAQELTVEVVENGFRQAGNAVLMVFLWG